MLIERLKRQGFQIEFRSHAEAILGVDFPLALLELESALRSLTIPIDELVRSGGGETKGTQRLRRSLTELGWNKGVFEIKKTINDKVFESQSHIIDHVKSFDAGTVVLEIEWNNKDPFFDRDLENFKRLHAEGAISVGIIVTRGSDMQERMRDLVRRFATDKGLADMAGLATLGLNPRSDSGKIINGVLSVLELHLRMHGLRASFRINTVQLPLTGKNWTIAFDAESEIPAHCC